MVFDAGGMDAGPIRKAPVRIASCCAETGKRRMTRVFRLFRLAALLAAVVTVFFFDSSAARAIAFFRCRRAWSSLLEAVRPRCPARPFRGVRSDLLRRLRQRISQQLLHRLCHARGLQWARHAPGVQFYGICWIAC